ncbi:MAG: TetR/AcrR family transcriptional regulator C-terminal domain-containing protein [Lachnospiraceae bacterium]|nr:TetR/AcrR family transcriptional regulator C-terminal domain-containing protein [Lachnospiraceae bacterium]
MTESSAADERYAVVEEAIIGAFFLLLEEKDAWHISVSDVVKRAGIVRSTFYNHYKDMPALISEIEDKTVNDISVMMKAFHPHGSRELCRSYFLSMCNYALENKFFRDIFTSSNATHYLGKSMSMFHKYISEVVPRTPNSKENHEAKAFAIAYTIGGVVGILHKWIKDGFEVPAEEVADLLTDMFSGGTMNYFS